MRIAAKVNGAVAVGVLVGVAAAAFAMQRGVAVQQEYDALLAHEVAQVEQARQMQLTFKKQVQSWKDILLRGSDPAALEKYSKEFFGLEKTVDDTAVAAQEALTNREAKEKAGQFAEEHKKLGEKYRAALAVFRESKGKDFARADVMVKGQDRAPTDLIDGMVGDLQQAYRTKQAETVGASARSRHVTIGVILVAATLALLLAGRLSRGVTSATARVLERAEAIASGDLAGSEIVIRSRDELGDLSRAMNKMQASLRMIVSSLTANASQVAGTSEELSTTSQEIAANSEETSAQANVVSAATEEINRNLQTIATATEELSSSVSEIARNATEAAKVAGEALQAATQTDTTMAKLEESSTEIGKVVKVITAIAQQTNLLALNATIEAARAGDAGKGFAVVANEVKELAKQTASATEDITQRIRAIQLDSKGAAEAIGRIGGIIGKVNSISATIATAVEEQSATTTEMSRNISEAAKGSGEVARNITGVAQAAESTSQGIAHSKEAAQNLAKMSTHLRELVAQFKVEATGNGRRKAA